MGAGLPDPPLDEALDPPLEDPLDVLEPPFGFPPLDEPPELLALEPPLDELADEPPEELLLASLPPEVPVSPPLVDELVLEEPPELLPPPEEPPELLVLPPPEEPPLEPPVGASRPFSTSVSVFPVDTPTALSAPSRENEMSEIIMPYSIIDTPRSSRRRFLKRISMVLTVTVVSGKPLRLN